MAGLGLMNRRRAIQSSPSRYNPLEDVVFYSELVGDGAAYIVVPDFYMQRWDSVEVEYSTNTQAAAFLFGSRWGNSITWLISPNSGGIFYSNWFDANSTNEPMSMMSQAVFGENLVAKTNLAYSNVQNGLRRIYYQNGVAVLAVATGNESDEYTAPLYIFASNQSSLSLVDSRILQGSILSFVVKDYYGNVKMDLKPCTYQGEAGMWDSISLQFFRNAGSGQFLVK